MNSRGATITDRFGAESFRCGGPRWGV